MTASIMGITLRELATTPTDYRLLKRFVPRASYGNVASPSVALYLDTETTSLDTATARVIEFAAVRFEFNSDGAIGRIVDAFDGLEDPGEPLSEQTVALTGITAAQVKGQRLDDDAIAKLVCGCSIVFAHNAGYDRPIVERRWPGLFDRLPFGCSQREVPWRESFACGCCKLGHVLIDTCGEFHHGHRALDDAQVGVHLLAAATDTDGRPALAYLLDRVREPSVRLWATGAPFETKDALSARRYHWFGGSPTRRKAWWKDVQPDDEATERQWLAVYCGVNRAPSEILTARDRYSMRAEP